jgi:hypothetical protein
LIFNEPHGFIFQTIELYITTTARTAFHTYAKQYVQIIEQMKTLKYVGIKWETCNVKTKSVGLEKCIKRMEEEAPKGIVLGL